MKVINLFGGPGCGKSTIAAGLFYELKRRRLNVELVTEYAKDLLYSDHLETMMENQEVIYAEQNFRMQRLIGKVDYVVTDSPILLSAVYPVINHVLFGTKEWPALPEFQALVRKQFRCYDNVNIWLARPDDYDDTGRLQDEGQAKWIDQVIWEELGDMRRASISFGNHVVPAILAILDID